MDPSSFDAVLLIVGLYFIIIVATAIKLVQRSIQIQKKNIELHKKRFETEIKLKEAELKLLKAQIHPHFLFNTLNNLYGLTLEKSDDAPNLVLRLSEILDYILYRCNEKQVLLSEEIYNLKNYIEIEKVRYSEKLKLEMNFPNIVENLRIAPLILLPFVENAFKHGVSKSTGIAFVKIKLMIDGKNLTFNITNTKNPMANSNETYSKGIGLVNVKKRLDMIYPKNYILTIDGKNEQFSVNLSLQLNE
jgi:LytS/YehU family sensor histidine kinase